MRVLRKDNSPTNISLTIYADATDLAPIKRHVLSHFKNIVRVPGFREGKAPEELVEKHVDQQRLLDEFMEHALNDIYRRAIDHEQIKPVATPNVQLKKFVPYTELEFTAEAEILGEIKLPNYKSMKLTKKLVDITAKEVDEVIKSLQTRLAIRSDVGRAAKEGDELVIDFEGKDKSAKPIAGADGKDYPLIIGSKSFIPGFEEKLIGTKAGELVEFDITFPADYGAPSLQNQKVKFKVTVKKVQELKEPPVNDEFAAKVGPFKSVTDLKADIKKQLSAEKQRQSDIDYQNQIIKSIVEKTQLEIPNSLIEDELQHLEDQEKQNLSYRGQTWHEHLEAEGITEEEHRDRHRQEATERVKAGLILSEIAQIEGIEVTPEEKEIRRQILKGQYQDPKMQAELDKPANLREIEARLMTEKTISKLVDYVNK